MNKLIPSAKTFLALLLIAITSISCSEEDVPALGFEDLGEVHMKYTFNGTVYNTPDLTTINLANKTVDAINGSGSNLKRLTLFMPLNPTVGTHFMTDAPSDNNAYGGYFLSQGDNVDILSDAGIITITVVTEDYVKGTFNFSGPNGPATINITEGTFLAER